MRATRGVWRGALALLAAALLAWHNSFSGPFILDDAPAILENSTLRALWPPSVVLSPPGEGQTVSGRPIVNLSLALNWALSGERVAGYHVVNLLIHTLAGLALFGLARRTWQSPALGPRFESAAAGLAFGIAALWTLHPLQTESVTYIVQRAESLVGLWLLLTLYAATRGLTSERPMKWQVCAVASCALGMATKEVMFAAPLLVLLHDRTFFAGTFGSALRRRPGFYAALGVTWLLLGWLVAQTGNRGATAGFGLGISPWHYLLTQCSALVHYLRLVFWPSPLVLDYGFNVVDAPRAVWMQGLLLCGLAGATLLAVIRGSAWGFLGACFFLLLAPSSSLVPVATQTIAEHRMYLPLAAVIAGAIAGLTRLVGTDLRRLWPLLAVGAAFGLLVAHRNLDYRSALAIWNDTAAKRPQNARAHQELGLALQRAGRSADSLPHFERALQLTPDYNRGRHNYATALTEVGRLDEAAAQFEIILRTSPDFAQAIYGLGNVRLAQGRREEALALFLQAIRLQPGFVGAHNNVGILLGETGQVAAAGAHFEAAVRGQPDFVAAYTNWAHLLARTGRPAEAIPLYQKAAQLAPGDLETQENLGVVLVMAGRVAEGIRQLETTVRLAPGRESARRNLESARAQLANPR